MASLPKVSKNCLIIWVVISLATGLGESCSASNDKENGAGIDRCGESGSDGVVRLGNVRVQANIALKVEKEGYDERDDNIQISDLCPPSIQIPLNPTSNDGRIVMSWFSDEPRDLDLHMSSETCHIFYSSKTCGNESNTTMTTYDEYDNTTHRPKTYPQSAANENTQNNLDLDNTSGGLAGGPETITVNDYSSDPKYAVYVRQFSETQNQTMCATGAKVEIYPGNGQPSRTIEIPTNCNNKRYWFVGCFTRGTGLAGFEVKSQMTSAEPSYTDC